MSSAAFCFGSADCTESKSPAPAYLHTKDDDRWLPRGYHYHSGVYNHFSFVFSVWHGENSRINTHDDVLCMIKVSGRSQLLDCNWGEVTVLLCNTCLLHFRHVYSIMVHENAQHASIEKVYLSSSSPLEILAIDLKMVALVAPLPPVIVWPGNTRVTDLQGMQKRWRPHQVCPSQLLSETDCWLGSVLRPARGSLLTNTRRALPGKFPTRAQPNPCTSSI